MIRPLRPQPSRAADRPAAAGEVRLIGGRWKRTRIPVADAPGLRPTPDRVRETLFNWLGQDLTGWRCLDAFAGSGALGFEAASRGAAEVVVVEREAHLVAALQALQARLEAGAVRIVAADALAWMSACREPPFDLVLIDPPFGADLFEAALRVARPLVAARGFIYLEADRAFDDAACAVHGLALHRRLRAGQVHAHLLRPATDAT